MGGELDVICCPKKDAWHRVTITKALGLVLPPQEILVIRLAQEEKQDEEDGRYYIIDRSIKYEKEYYSYFLFR